MMNMQIGKLTFITGLYNEDLELASRISVIHDGLRRRFGDNFEIILVENGSTDGTREALEKLESLNCYDGRIRVFFLDHKGLGLAYRKGIEEARGDYILLSAVDLPFGFTDIDQLLEKRLSSQDLIFFSKAHRDSKIQRAFSRRLSSKLFNLMLRMFFAIDVADTQGSIFMSSAGGRELLKYATSPTLFFTAQLAIYSRHAGLINIELPIVGSKPLVFRKSAFKIFRDGLFTLADIYNESLRYAKTTRK